MTNSRKISINITLKTLAKNNVMNVDYFMHENKTELVKAMKEAEETQHWTDLQNTVKEIIARY